MAKRKRTVKVRRFWRIHPRTRVKPSKRVYRRPKVKRQIKEAFLLEEGGNEA